MSEIEVSYNQDDFPSEMKAAIERGQKAAEGRMAYFTLLPRDHQRELGESEPSYFEHRAFVDNLLAEIEDLKEKLKLSETRVHEAVRTNASQQDLDACLRVIKLLSGGKNENEPENPDSAS